MKGRGNTFLFPRDRRESGTVASQSGILQLGKAIYVNWSICSDRCSSRERKAIAVEGIRKKALPSFELADIHIAFLGSPESNFVQRGRS